MVNKNKYGELEKLSEEISRCGRCGFCQSVCPVYQATAHEEGVARGRNMFAKELLARKLDLSKQNEAFFTECLLCRACVEMCFSSVKTDEIVLAMRRENIRARGISPLQRYLLNNLLRDHRRLARALRLVAKGRTTGALKLAQALDIFGWYGSRFRRMSDILAQLPESFLRERLHAKGTDDLRRGLSKATGTDSIYGNSRLLEFRRMVSVPRAKEDDQSSDTSTTPEATSPAANKKMFLFIGCGMNFMFPDSGEATTLILEKLDYEVVIKDNGCCGLPAYAHGAIESALRLATDNISLFSGSEDLIITDCSSCASFLKKYPTIIAEAGDDKNLVSKAHAFAARVRDITEILSDGDCPKNYGPELVEGRRFGTVPINKPLAKPLRVTFHDPCHLSRHQKLSVQARRILRSLPNVEFIEMKEADWCCGGAGAFALEHPDLSLQILKRKIRNIEQSGADIVATTCPSCMMQLRGGLLKSEGGRQVQVMHISDLLRK